MYHHPERILDVWENGIKATFDQNTHKPIHLRQIHLIEHQLFGLRLLPALVAAEALQDEGEVLASRLNKGMRIRPIGQLFSQWYGYTTFPIYFANGASNHISAHSYTNILISSNLPDSIDQSSEPSNEDLVNGVQAVFEDFADRLNQDRTGKDLVKHARDTYLLDAVFEMGPIGDMVRDIAMLGSERYNTYIKAVMLCASGRHFNSQTVPA